MYKVFLIYFFTLNIYTWMWPYMYEYFVWRFNHILGTPGVIWGKRKVNEYMKFWEVAEVGGVGGEGESIIWIKARQRRVLRQRLNKIKHYLFQFRKVLRINFTSNFLKCTEIAHKFTDGPEFTEPFHKVH